MELFGIPKIVDPAGVKLLYKEEAARGTRMLYELGFSPCDVNGDVSVRDPETGYVYISGSPKQRPNSYHNLGEYRASDMAVMDLDGNYLVPWADATCEAPMHLAIYRQRPDIHAIVHTHATWSSAWAVSRKSIPLVLPEQQGHLGGEVGCANFGTPGSEALAEDVATVIGQDKFAALLGNHGAVTIGCDLDEAFGNAFFLEAVAQKAWLAMQLGELPVLDPQKMFVPTVFSYEK